MIALTRPSSLQLSPVAIVTLWLLLVTAPLCSGQFVQNPSVYPGVPTPYIPPVNYQQPGYAYPQRPGYTQGSYGGYSSYSSSHMRSADSSEETLDNAQRTAMAPLNSVITSLPLRSEFLPFVHMQAPVALGQRREAEGSYDPQVYSPCGTGSSGCPLAKSANQSSGTVAAAVKSQETPVEPSQPQPTQEQQLTHEQQQQQLFQQATNRQLPATTGCNCPCSHYAWMYSGFPSYDFSYAVYPRPAVNPYAYVMPYAVYPDKTSTSRSARTFWLPWAAPAVPTVQNPVPLGYQDYYNRRYYTRRY